MALRDHFHPPLLGQRHWASLHNGWASNLAAELNRFLPDGYFAEPTARFGIEVDVAAFTESPAPDPPATLRESAVAPYLALSASNGVDGWQPIPPAHRIPFDPVAETFEVLVYNETAGPILVGAIELVSPANKDRRAHRSAFVAKCEAYLREGVGLVMVDIVTERRANLHNVLMRHLAFPLETLVDAPLYATAYRLLAHEAQPQLDIWPAALAIGNPLPTLPLWLQGELSFPVDLEATYEKTCREQRIPEGAPAT